MKEMKERKEMAVVGIAPAQAREVAER